MLTCLKEAYLLIFYVEIFDGPETHSNEVEDFDMFGDDEEILQLFQEESIWTTVNSMSNGPAIPELNLSGKQTEMAFGEPASLETKDLDKDLDQVINKDFAKDPKEHLEIMNEDLPESLTVPDIPEVDMIPKDLGITDTDQLDDTLDELPDVPDFDMDELPIFSQKATKQPIMNEIIEGKVLIPSKMGELNTVSSVSTPSSCLQTDTFNRNLNSFDAMEKLSEPSSTEVERPAPKVSLRQRNAIQLRPFTLEQEHYQKLLGRLKYMVVDTNITQMGADANDTQFTISNTQLADISTEEIQPSQYTPSKRKEPKAKQKTHRVSAPSKSTKQRSTAKPESSTSNLLQTPALENASLEKYGLPKLLVPAETEEIQSKNVGIITFAKRKGSKRKRPTARKPIRFPEPVNKDIFAFDMHPQSAFSLRTPTPIENSADTASSSTRNNGNMGPPSEIQIGAPTIWDLTLENDQDDNSSVMGNGSVDYGEDIEVEDDEMEDSQLNFSTRLRNKKHLELDSTDDDSDNSINDDPVKSAPTEEELDVLFTFPAESTSTGNSSIKRSLGEEDVVPIVQDELEYRETKRQRMTLQSLLKNRKALKGILPASFLKIYASQIEDEMKSKKRVKPSKSIASKPLTSANTRVKQKNVPSKNTEDIFAAFRESESEDDTDSSEEASDVYSTMNDYVIRSDPQTSSNSSNSTDTFRLPPKRSNTSYTNIFSNNRTQISSSQDSGPKLRQSTPSMDHPRQLLFVNNMDTESSRHEHNTSSTKSPPIPRNKLLNHQSNARQNYINLYPPDESMEDNRVNPLYGRSKLSSASETRTRKRTTSNSNNNGSRKTPKSSIAIGKPSEKHNVKHSFQIRDNATPQRRRKRHKRPKDDIYVHAPTFTWFNHDRSGQAPESNVRMFFRESDTPFQKAFDDIYVGTRQSARYTRELWDRKQEHDQESESVDHINDRRQVFNKSLNVHAIHSLQSVVKRIRNLHDHDLRRIYGLDDTVYIHHRLLQPLMSENPNLKSAYQHFQQDFKDLYLFDRYYTWQNINYNEKKIIDFLFSKATQDLYHACNLCQEEKREITEIPHHDHFYTFVSICLTQWIPCLPYEERIQLVDLFLEHIRCLAWLIPKIVENTQLNTPWRPIIKLLLFILDWSCRLHHLGVHPLDWAVTDCTQYLMDVLVYIGYEGIRSATNCKTYIIEAWICLIQIVSVSSKGCGYYFHEQIFVDQLTDSIKRKSKTSSFYEYEKRKTTRLWAETLNHILDKYILM
jgi:hypothetical protein